MSSTVFEVVLRPDPALRRIVQWSGIGLSATGLVLLLQLPVAPSWRFILGIIWALDCLRELRNQARGNRRLRALVLDSNGQVAAIDRRGNRHQLTLLTGSVVLSGLAWMRVKCSPGAHHGELFTRRQTAPETWHRLQLLWLQSREAFGQQPGP